MTSIFVEKNPMEAWIRLRNLGNTIPQRPSSSSKRGKPMGKTSPIKGPELLSKPLSTQKKTKKHKNNKPSNKNLRLSPCVDPLRPFLPPPPPRPSPHRRHPPFFAAKVHEQSAQRRPLRRLLGSSRMAKGTWRRRHAVFQR